MIVQIVIKRMTNEKVRAELLGKKELDVQKVRSVCFRFQAAKTAADIITDGHKLKPEIDRVQKAGQTEVKSEEVAEIDRVGNLVVVVVEELVTIIMVIEVEVILVEEKVEVVAKVEAEAVSCVVEIIS